MDKETRQSGSVHFCLLILINSAQSVLHFESVKMKKLKRV